MLSITCQNNLMKIFVSPKKSMHQIHKKWRPLWAHVRKFKDLITWQNSFWNETVEINPNRFINLGEKWELPAVNSHFTIRGFQKINKISDRTCLFIKLRTRILPINIPRGACLSTTWYRDPHPLSNILLWCSKEF